MKKLLRTLNGEVQSIPPIWLMRQAGRYLAEYRAERQKAKNFLDFCYTPDLSVEVTLQPIRRYGFDASILFADILLIPDALGQKVEFQEGVGPVLEAIEDEADIEKLNGADVVSFLSPVFETVRRLSQELPDETTLIGFCGAPWTVATYMIGGRGSPDQAAAKQFAYRYPEAFDRLISLLVTSSVDYLKAQIDAGAEVIQLFDTWAGSLSPALRSRHVIEPTAEIVRQLKAYAPNVPVIGFPRGIGSAYVDFVRDTKVDGVSIDTGMSPEWARDHLQGLVTVQGNLDPLNVVIGGPQMIAETDRILRALGDGPFIFNLGHGIVPQTPPENVQTLVDYIRSKS